MFLETLRAVYGLLELASPDTVTVTALGRKPDTRMRTVIRVLGARHVAQSVLTMAKPHTMHRLGGAVDLIHAGSMVGLAILDRRRRRAALVNAVVAALFGVAELRHH
ncbi:hypothetical protein [uncultured Leifsonia sp.]|uniref:hypothetical protein n=1 Tax=uncultured Leifsonia sp. TaxID=340359 RepID=UPI0025E5CCA4|nr:hypothetical protein [uncultured Leifsonia sp.]